MRNIEIMAEEKLVERCVEQSAAAKHGTGDGDSAVPAFQRLHSHADVRRTALRWLLLPLQWLALQAMLLMMQQQIAALQARQAQAEAVQAVGRAQAATDGAGEAQQLQVEAEDALEAAQLRRAERQVAQAALGDVQAWEAQQAGDFGTGLIRCCNGRIGCGGHGRCLYPCRDTLEGCVDPAFKLGQVLHGVPFHQSLFRSSVLFIAKPSPPRQRHFANRQDGPMKQS